MTEMNSLLDRIDAEFAAAAKQIKDFQNQEVQAYQGRQKRLELFDQACHTLKETWKPRLEGLAKRFGDNVKVTPKVSRNSREAKFEFKSPLAAIVLSFRASTDMDVRHLVLDYDLHILPVLQKFQSHSQAEFPLEPIDAAAVGSWIDDRIVDFVKTYLSLQQNENYLREHMVVDPISQTRFPKYAAAESLDWNGTKYYFVGTETKEEFEKQKGIANK